MMILLICERTYKKDLMKNKKKFLKETFDFMPGLPVSSFHLFLFEIIFHWSLVTDLNHQQVIQVCVVSTVNNCSLFCHQHLFTIKCWS
jgi:hypothetical protein